MFGNGSDGALDVTTGTTNLALNQKYQYTTVNVASGATLSTNSTVGAVLYITATESITINGTIDVSNKLNSGQFTNSVVIDGVTYTVPGVANGGNGGADTAFNTIATQSLGFGGGGAGGYAFYPSVKGGNGGPGNSTFGTGGAGVSSTAENTDASPDVEVNTVGQNATGSKGGSGGAYAHAWDDTSTAGIARVRVYSGVSGVGASAYGATGGASSTGSVTVMGGAGSYYYQYATGGGGGGGGIAGKSGVHVVLKAPSITINGTVITKGMPGGAGGSGGAGRQRNGTLDYYGYGAGGGGGGKAGNVTLAYNTSLANSGTYTMTGGSGGSRGAGVAGSTQPTDGTAGTSGTTSIEILPRDKTQTATANIAKLVTKTQTAKARIGVAFTQLQTSTSRVANTRTKTQPIIARISNRFSSNQITTARVATNRGKTQLANGAIEKTASLTQPATALIVDSGEVLKAYDYKVYDGSEYLGLLPSVQGDYSHVNEINTVGSKISITVAQSSDISGFGSYQSIQDEAGGDIQDENGDPILSEGYPGIIGIEGGPSKLIKNGNRVKVIEYSKYYPNGKLMFVGRMVRWDASQGGDGGDLIKILVHSTGADFDEYMVTIGNTVITTQTNTASSVATGTYGGGFWQAIKPVGSSISLGQIKAKLAITSGVPQYLTALLCQGNPANDMFSVVSGTSTHALGSGNTQLDSSTAVLVSGSTPTDYPFKFSQNRTLAAGGSYYVVIVITSSKAGVGATISMKTADSSITPTAPLEKLYKVTANTNNASVSPTYSTANPVAYFELSTIGGNTYVHNTATDPVAGLMPQVMDNYIAQGGGLKYDSANSFQSSGLSLTFDLKLNTAYEALETSKGLAPSDFYYYVDLGTETLYEKKYSTTADIILTRAKNVGRVTFSSSIESVKNSVYFSGGKPDASPTNLFKVYTDSQSIADYGQRLVKKADNRVTLAGTADAIGNSFLGNASSEQYLTTVTVLDTMMDITLLTPGMMVGFRGYNSFYDSILLPLARVDYSPHQATLTLGNMPQRFLPTYEKVLRELQAEQTLDNPDTPT